MHDTKLASWVAGAVALTVLVYLWNGARGGEPAEARGANVSATRQDAPRHDEAARRDVSSTDTREAARVATEPRGAERVDAAPWAPPGFEYELELRVIDEADEPGLKERVFLAPAAHTLNDVGAADLDGRLIVRWLAFEPRMQVDVALARGEGLRRVELQAGFTSVALPKRGGSAAAASPTYAIRQRLDTLHKDLNAVKRPLSSESAPTALRDGQGRLQFVEPLLYASQASAIVLRTNSSGTSGFAATSQDKGARIVKKSSGAEDPEMGLISGRIVDADGEPVAGALLRANRVGGGPRPSALTDDEGSYLLRKLPPGEWDLRAGGGDFGRAAGRVSVSAGRTSEWSAALDRGAELTGQLVDSAQAPLAGWRLLAETLDSRDALVDVATSDEQGRFAIPNLPRAPLRLLARRRESAPGGEILVGEQLWPSEREQEFVLDTRADLGPGGLLLRISCDEGAPPGAATARAWRADTARAVTGDVYAPTHSPSPFAELSLLERGVACSALESGWYSLEIAAPGRELLTLPHVFVPAQQAVELPPLQAAPLATLAVGADELDEEQSVELQIVQRGAAVELRCSATEVSGGRGFLRPGDYRIVRTLGTSRVERWLRVEAGVVAELE